MKSARYTFYILPNMTVEVYDNRKMLQTMQGDDMTSLITSHFADAGFDVEIQTEILQELPVSWDSTTSVSAYATNHTITISGATNTSANIYCFNTRNHGNPE